MSHLEPFETTAEQKDALRRQLSRGKEVVPFLDNPELSAWVASLGIHREVGTLNDELARFVFDAGTGELVPRSLLRSTLVRYRKAVGVRIWSDEHPRLELRFRGMRALLHPGFSFHPDGTIASLVLFPESIARILALEGIEAVLVRPWALNTVFGGFDPSKHYYSTNFWELENNDTVRFAGLVEKRRLALLGTHDVVAHAAGAAGWTWDELSAKASEVGARLRDYFASISVPTIASLVLPYTAGVLLDDLAQPPNYGARSRHLVLDEVLSAISARVIPAGTPRVLMRFPSHYEKVIDLARDGELSDIQRRAGPYVRALTAEILDHSVVMGKATSQEDRRHLQKQAQEGAAWGAQ